MFCTNCGKKINDNDVFCIHCGVKVEKEVAAKPMEKPDNMNWAKAHPIQPVTPPAPEYPDIAPTQLLKEQPPKQPSEPATQPVTAQTELLRPEPARPSAGINSGVNPVYINPDFNQFNQGTAPEQMPASIPQQAGEKSNKKKIILISVISGVVATIAIIVAIVLALYFNSASYKISKAESLVAEAQYTEAIEAIEDIDSVEADAMRSYIDAMQLRSSFAEMVKTEAIIDSEEDELYLEAKAFCEKIVYICESEYYIYLPEAPRTKVVDYYNDITALNDFCFDSGAYDIYTALHNSQNVFLNKVNKNEGNYFTLSEMQENIDYSKEAISTIKNWNDGNFSIDGFNFGEACPEELEGFKTHMNKFIDSCESEITSEQDIVDENSKKFGMYESLYLENANDDYKSVVMSGLVTIDYSNDTYTNADILLRTYYVDMVAYIIR